VKETVNGCFLGTQCTNEGNVFSMKQSKYY